MRPSIWAARVAVAALILVTMVACATEPTAAPLPRTITASGGSRITVPPLPNTMTLPGVDESLGDVDMCAAIAGLCGAPICPGEALLGSRSDAKGTGWFVSGCGSLSKLVFKNIKVKLQTDVGLDVSVNAPDLDVDPGCVIKTITIPGLPAIPHVAPIIGPFGNVIWPGIPGRPAGPSHDVEVHVPPDCYPARPPSVSFTPPSLGQLAAYIHPNVDVEVEVEAAGSGSVSLRIPIPKATVKSPPIKIPMGPLEREYIGWGLGVYLTLEGRLTETSTHFVAKVKDDFLANLGFNLNDGWSNSMAQGPYDVTGSVNVESPDTTAFRYGIQPAVSIQIDPNKNGIGTILPGYQTSFGFWVNRYFENIFTLDPTGNLKNDANIGVKGRVYANFSIVTPGDDPPCSLADILTCDAKGYNGDTRELLNWDKPFTCCESDIYEEYGIGQFKFNGKTTGDAADRDPDGYALSWTRTNATPIPHVDSVMTKALGSVGSAFYPDAGDLVSNLPSNPFGALASIVCTEVHSDGVISAISPVGGVIPEVRRLFPGIPQYSKIFGCTALPADYTLTVTGLAQNCTLTDANPRVVTLRPLLSLAKFHAATNPFTWTKVRDVTEVDVNVYCRPLVGSLRLAAITTGADPDADGYDVFVDGVANGSVGANASTTVGGIRVGSHQAAIGGVAFNCAVSLPNPQSVSIQFEATADATARVSCVSAYSKACDMAKAGGAANQISPSGIVTSLCQKLQNADAARKNGDLAGVTDLMNSFASDVRAQRGKHVDAVVADALLAAAAYIARNGYLMP